MGQGRTRNLTSPKYNQGQAFYKKLLSPGILVKKFRENKNQEIEFQNWKKIDQNVEIYIWTNKMFYRGHSWLRFEILRLEFGSEIRNCKQNFKWCPDDRKRRKNIYIFFSKAGGLALEISNQRVIKMTTSMTISIEESFLDT